VESGIMMKTGNNPFVIIEGNQLSAVTFIKDYLQILFDGPRITAYTPPIIKTEESSYKWGDPGYRDSICDLIGQKVIGSKFLENEELTVQFEDGRKLSISLRSEDYIAAEAMIFEDDNDNWWTW
jgi:hypothetical protein